MDPLGRPAQPAGESEVDRTLSLPKWSNKACPHFLKQVLTGLILPLNSTPARAWPQKLPRSMSLKSCDLLQTSCKRHRRPDITEPFGLVADKAHIEESCSLGVGCFGDFALERLWFSSGQMRVARSSDPELRAWGQHVM